MSLLIQKVADRMGEKRGAGHGPLSKSKKLPERYRIIPVTFEGKPVGEIIVLADR